MTHVLSHRDVQNLLARNSIGGLNSLEDFFFASPAVTNSYPPYNIEKRSEDDYRLTVAVAGFNREEVRVELRDGHLIVEGDKRDDGKPREYIYQGIATRGFSRSFKLMEYVVVKSAEMRDGLLIVDLKRELPEALKPRVIDIA